MNGNDDDDDDDTISKAFKGKPLVIGEVGWIVM